MRSSKYVWALVAAAVALVAVPVHAQKVDFALVGSPTWQIRASETYPVVYPGGSAPAPVLGALDADDGTYNRLVDCSTLSGVGTAVSYDTITFTASGSNPADVTFELSTQGDPTTCPFDSHATVYSSFDPANPLQNCVAVNDDGGVGNCPLISVQVPAGATYTIVVTSFGNGTTGPWQANFTGTVPVELTHLSVE